MHIISIIPMTGIGIVETEAVYMIENSVLLLIWLQR